MPKRFDKRYQAQQEIYTYIIVKSAKRKYCINEDSEGRNVKLVECSQNDDLNNFEFPKYDQH